MIANDVIKTMQHKVRVNVDDYSKSSTVAIFIGRGVVTANLHTLEISSDNPAKSLARIIDTLIDKSGFGRYMVGRVGLYLDSSYRVENGVTTWKLALFNPFDGIDLIDGTLSKASFPKEITMSVSVYYRVINPATHGLNGQSTLVRQLSAVFGSLPIQLSSNDLEKLEVLASVWQGEDNPYREMIDAISENSSAIEVFAMY